MYFLLRHATCSRHDLNQTGEEEHCPVPEINTWIDRRQFKEKIPDPCHPFSVRGDLPFFGADVKHSYSTPDKIDTEFRAGYIVHCRTKSFGWVFASRMIGIICFLIVVVLANILTYYVSNPFFHSGVSFINENFWLLMLIAIILFAGAIFGAFPFPLNLPAPIIRAIGSVFCIAFILRVFQWVDVVASTTLYQLFWYLSFIIVPLVFLIVLASGYFEIMRQLWWQPRIDTQADGQAIHSEPVHDEAGQVSDVKSWEEIGAEFRMMLYDIIHRFRQEIQRKQ